MSQQLGTNDRWGAQPSAPRTPDLEPVTPDPEPGSNMEQSQSTSHHRHTPHPSSIHRRATDLFGSTLLPPVDNTGVVSDRNLGARFGFLDCDESYFNVRPSRYQIRNLQRSLRSSSAEQLLEPELQSSLRESSPALGHPSALFNGPFRPPGALRTHPSSPELGLRQNLQPGHIIPSPTYVNPYYYTRPSYRHVEGPGNASRHGPEHQIPQEESPGSFPTEQSQEKGKGYSLRFSAFTSWWNRIQLMRSKGTPKSHSDEDCPTHSRGDSGISEISINSIRGINESVNDTHFLDNIPQAKTQDSGISLMRKLEMQRMPQQVVEVASFILYLMSSALHKLGSWFSASSALRIENGPGEHGGVPKDRKRALMHTSNRKQIHVDSPAESDIISVVAEASESNSNTKLGKDKGKGKAREPLFREDFEDRQHSDDNYLNLSDSDIESVLNDTINIHHDDAEDSVRCGSSLRQRWATTSMFCEADWLEEEAMQDMDGVVDDMTSPKPSSQHLSRRLGCRLSEPETNLEEDNPGILLTSELGWPKRYTEEPLGAFLGDWRKRSVVDALKDGPFDGNLRIEDIRDAPSVAALTGFSGIFKRKARNLSGNSRPSLEPLTKSDDRETISPEQRARLQRAHEIQLRRRDAQAARRREQQAAKAEQAEYEAHVGQIDWSKIKDRLMRRVASRKENQQRQARRDRSRRLSSEMRSKKKIKVQTLAALSDNDEPEEVHMMTKHSTELGPGKRDMRRSLSWFAALKDKHPPRVKQRVASEPLPERRPLHPFTRELAGNRVNDLFPNIASLHDGWKTTMKRTPAELSDVGIEDDICDVSPHDQGFLFNQVAVSRTQVPPPQDAPGPEVRTMDTQADSVGATIVEENILEETVNEDTEAERDESIVKGKELDIMEKNMKNTEIDAVPEEWDVYDVFPVVWF